MNPDRVAPGGEGAPSPSSGAPGEGGRREHRLPWLRLVVEPLSEREAVLEVHPLVAHYDEHMIRENNDLVLRVCHPRNRVLIDARPLRFLSLAGRREAADPRMEPFTIAMAVLVAGPISVALSRLFIALFTPPYPMVTFNDEAKARAWLMAQPDAPEPRAP